MVDIARLQRRGAACQPHHGRGKAVGPEAVDDLAVTLLPQHAAEPHRRADEDEVVDLVEVPLVEQELVQHHLLLGGAARQVRVADIRSEEHTSELQSLMRISYAVFCLKKK